MTKTYELHLRVGDFLYPVQVHETDSRYYFKFNFNKSLMAHLKSLSGTMYHQFQGTEAERALLRKLWNTDKIWSVAKNAHNEFQLDYLKNLDPYSAWDKVDLKLKCHRDKAYEHQSDMFRHWMAKHYMVWAAEMGTGKTLAGIEGMEYANPDGVWWVAPKSGLKALARELKEWDSKIIPEMFTYEGLVKRMREWQTGDKAPQMVILDESSRCKTPTSQRSEAAMALAEGIRKDWGKDGFVLLMSGSPAPKAPTDWWWQCEIACPGFLREGTLVKFAERLGIFEKKESPAGGVHSQKISWLDDDRKCAKCGGFAKDPQHGDMASCMELNTVGHPFVQSVNEVAKLYNRMQGLVLVKRKKDCLSLPEKIYRRVQCPISKSIVRAAQMILQTTPRAAEALILLRELSDGFQYTETEDGVTTCPLCSGTKIMDDYIRPNGTTVDSLTEAEIAHDTSEGADAQSAGTVHYMPVQVPCTKCGATGFVPRFVRGIARIECPKDDAFIDLLDEHLDVGRIVAYGGFQGSVDRIQEICTAQKWATIRWDGRGIKILDQNGSVASGDALEFFQKDFQSFPRLAFVGQPGAAGMGITLTASPSIVYYSNTFGGEDRIQSEDRIHRPGCTGANIWDILHLPTDLKILENLIKKRELQDLTLGEITEALMAPVNRDAF